MSGYWNKPDQTAEVFTEDGFFTTGDIAEIDDDGFLLIVDRKKDLIVTAGGKNVAPQPIESQLKKSPFVETAVLIGDRRPYIVALFSPSFEDLERWAEEERRRATPTSRISSATRRWRTSSTRSSSGPTHRWPATSRSRSTASCRSRCPSKAVSSPRRSRSSGGSWNSSSPTLIERPLRRLTDGSSFADSSSSNWWWSPARAASARASSRRPSADCWPPADARSCSSRSIPGRTSTSSSTPSPRAARSSTRHRGSISNTSNHESSSTTSSARSSRSSCWSTECSRARSTGTSPKGAPGLKESAVFGRALRMVDGPRSAGAPPPDVVILDAPATGHGVSWLAAPQLVADVVRSGPIGHMAELISAFLGDRHRFGVVVVTTAEEMPVEESLELIARPRRTPRSRARGRHRQRALPGHRRG